LKELGSNFKHQETIIIKNGNDFGYTFADIWELYVSKHLVTVEKSTFDRKVQNAKLFYNNLMSVPMVELTASFISDYLAVKKEEALDNKNSRRFNFNDDLKSLKAILNWYRENVDAQFVNPILKKHKLEGLIKKAPKRKKKMKRHELIAFFEELEKDSLFWRDLAEVQFYFSGRVQEVAGLQWQSVDFVDGVIEIENVAVWGPQKSFLYLKDSPKNGEDRNIFMTERLFEILTRRFKERSPKQVEDKRSGKFVLCDFVFHEKGSPLDYRKIHYRYNRALQKAGLGDKFSSTHILRHSMANLVRERMGLDHAQAVGGWKTRELVEHVYTERPAHLTKDALMNIDDFMNEDLEGNSGPEFPLLKLVR
jgi:integrase